MPYRLVLYLLLVVLSYAGASLLSNAVGYLPVLFLLLILPADLLWAFVASRYLRGKGLKETRSAERLRPAGISFPYINSGRFFACFLRITLKIKGPKGTRALRRRAALSIPPKGKASVRFSFTSHHIGIYQIRILRARVYGPFGLIGFALPRAGSGVLIATPGAAHKSEFNPESLSAEPNEDATPDTGFVQNLDSTSGAREYVPGDPMRSIHWKLTAHQLKLMTRLYEKEADIFATVAIDLRPIEGSVRQQLITHDRLCEAAFEAVCNCVKEGIGARLIYSEQGLPHSITVKSEPELPDAAAVIASADHTAPFTDLAPISASGTPTRGSLIAVTSRLDTELADRLCDCASSAKSLYVYVPPQAAEIKPEESFFHYLEAHDVQYTVARFEQLPPQKEILLNAQA